MPFLNFYFYSVFSSLMEKTQQFAFRLIYFNIYNNSFNISITLQFHLNRLIEWHGTRARMFSDVATAHRDRNIE